MKKIILTHAVIGIGILLLAVAVLVPGERKTAHIRSKFNRIASALEAYALDNGGKYPPDIIFQGQPYFLHPIISTPIAYLAAEDLVDPFAPSPFMSRHYLRYINIDDSIGNAASSFTREQYPHYLERHGHWIVWSGTMSFGNPETRLTLDPIPYDATNGTQHENFDRRAMTGSFRSQRMSSETGHVN